MKTETASFDDAIRAIRLAAAAAEPLPHGLPFNKAERGEALAIMPRRSFSFPVPGNPRGMTVSAVDHRETLEALADKLEAKARLFGGKPPKKVRKTSRTSGYQAARSAFAEGHHRQVHRSLGDRLAFIVGKNGSLYPVMLVEEFERAGHTWAIAWPVSGKTRTLALGHHYRDCIKSWHRCQTKMLQMLPDQAWQPQRQPSRAWTACQLARIQRATYHVTERDGGRAERKMLDSIRCRPRQSRITTPGDGVSRGITSRLIRHEHGPDQYHQFIPWRQERAAPVRTIKASKAAI